ncbi:21674_t:CDS:2 [Gigaspora rosea]|nr:21674_t:CDS:2 [Gigaspora rosea]
MVTTNCKKAAITEQSHQGTLLYYSDSCQILTCKNKANNA